MLTISQDLIRSGADDVKTAALETLGNLAFVRENKVTFLHSPGLLSWLNSLARGQVGSVSQRGVQTAATRVLAVLGGASPFMQQAPQARHTSLSAAFESSMAMFSFLPHNRSAQIASAAYAMVLYSQ